MDDDTPFMVILGHRRRVQGSASRPRSRPTRPQKPRRERDQRI